MRISDWSSDVCSSDLSRADRPGDGGRRGFLWTLHPRLSPGDDPARGRDEQRRLDRPHAGDAVGEVAASAVVGVAGGAAAASRENRCRPWPHRPALRRRRHLARSEEHTSELQSLMRISYAVFCLKKKKQDKSSLIILSYT